MTKAELDRLEPLQRVAWQSALWTVDSTAPLTSGLRVRPDFLIVGAQRCGTTSMFKTLSQHPQVVRPFLRKGIHYFDMYYDKGPRWYGGHFPFKATAARGGGQGRRITGESSPYYMFHPLARQRLAADLPNVKVIVMLRDPVVRAYSAHSHEVARGFETLEFEQALGAEAGRLAGERERLMTDPGHQSEHWQHHAYLTRGQYIEQVQALEDLLGRDRMLVVDSEDFFVDPEPAFAQVLEFLNLDKADGIEFERHNSRSRSPLDDSLRAKLEGHFEPYDNALADWWARTPSWRRG
ncbi:MAG: sulfotransferase family protein [Nocardioides sp.]